MITGMRGDDSEENRDSGMLANEELLPWGDRQYFPLPTTADSEDLIYSQTSIERNQSVGFSKSRIEPGELR